MTRGVGNGEACWWWLGPCSIMAWFGQTLARLVDWRVWQVEIQDVDLDTTRSGGQAAPFLTLSPAKHDVELLHWCPQLNPCSHATGAKAVPPQSWERWGGLSSSHEQWVQSLDVGSTNTMVLQWWPVVISCSWGMQQSAAGRTGVFLSSSSPSQQSWQVDYHQNDCSMTLKKSQCPM